MAMDYGTGDRFPDGNYDVGDTFFHTLARWSYTFTGTEWQRDEVNREPAPKPLPSRERKPKREPKPPREPKPSKPRRSKRPPTPKPAAVSVDVAGNVEAIAIETTEPKPPAIEAAIEPTGPRQAGPLKPKPTPPPARCSVPRADWVHV
jgi:hypothetical protein